MKKTTRIAALAMVAAVMAGTLAGCGGGGSSTAGGDGATTTKAADSAAGGTADGAAKDDKSPITIRMSAPSSYEFDPATDAVAKKIVDDFGITFENVGYEGDVEKMMLDGQSGQLADIVYTEPLYDLYSFTTFIDQGFFRSIPEDMLADFPNVKKVIEESAVCQAIKEQYGEYYIIPKPDSKDPTVYIGERKGIFYRKDWLKKVGIEKEPTTYEELYEMTKAFTTKDPDGNGKNDTYGMTSDGFGNFRYFMSNLGHSNLNWVKGPDGTWTHGALLEDNIYALEWFRKMYAEGYLDPEIGSTKYEQAMQKFASQQFGAVNRNADADWIKTVIVDQFYAATQATIENPFDAVGVIPALAKDANSPVMMEKYIDTMCATQIAATCTDDTLRRYLTYHEYLLSDEGNLFQLGLENVDWKRDGEKIVMIPGDDGLMPKVGTKYKSMPVANMQSWGFDLRSNPNIETFTIYNDEIKAMDADLRAKRNDNVVESDMRVKMLSEQSLLDANMFKFSVEYSNIVTGTEPVDKMFKDMVDRAMASGFTQAIEDVNKIATEKGW